MFQRPCECLHLLAAAAAAAPRTTAAVPSASRNIEMRNDCGRPSLAGPGPRAARVRPARGQGGPAEIVTDPDEQMAGGAGRRGRAAGPIRDDGVTALRHSGWGRTGSPTPKYVSNGHGSADIAGLDFQ